MALPFTDEQRLLIRGRLLESAQRHALLEGVAKTSLDTLTSDAGISKSSFTSSTQARNLSFWRSPAAGKNRFSPAGKRRFLPAKSCPIKNALPGSYTPSLKQFITWASFASCGRICNI